MRNSQCSKAKNSSRQNSIALLALVCLLGFGLVGGIGVLASAGSRTDTTTADHAEAVLARLIYGPDAPVMSSPARTEVGHAFAAPAPGASSASSVSRAAIGHASAPPARVTPKSGTSRLIGSSASSKASARSASVRTKDLTPGSEQELGGVASSDEEKQALGQDKKGGADPAASDTNEISFADVGDATVPEYIPENYLTEATFSAAQGITPEKEPNETSATATPLGGSNVVGKGNNYKLGNAPAAAVGDVDFWSFSGTAGDRVYASTMTGAAPSSSTDTSLVLFSTDGTTVIETDLDDGSINAGSSTIAGATLPATGTFFLRVIQSNTFPGTSRVAPYFLHFRRLTGAPTAEPEGTAAGGVNDTTGTATAMPVDGWVSGTHGVSTDQDFFSFSLSAGDSVAMLLDGDPERDNVQWNPRLGFGLLGDASNFTLDVDDASVGSVTNPLSEALEFTVKTAGTYYARVYTTLQSTGGATQTYHLNVSVHPATPIGTSCTVYTSTDIPKTIGPGAVTTNSTITVPGNPRIEDLNVSITLDHRVMADIDAALLSPAGNENSLFTDIGSTVTATTGQQLMDIDLDDEAALPVSVSTTVQRPIGWTPEVSYRLAWLKGELGGGTWTLRLRDDGNTTLGGNLTAWSLTICEPPAPTACAGVTVTRLATDFESGAAGFTHAAVAGTDNWALGLPSAAPITTCNSGTNCWKTNLTGLYSINSTMELLSPTFSLSGLGAPVTVSWAQKYEVESATFDSYWAEVREPGPTNVTNLFQHLDATMSDLVGSPSATILESAGWGLVTRSIDAYANKASVQLRWNLGSDSSVPMVGVAIDDVTVTACCTAASCDDGNVCTDDICDAVLGCTHSNNSGPCSDGNACTGPDFCSGGTCQPGPNPCNDGNVCTNDICDPGGGPCTYTPVICNDSNPCTDDVCVPLTTGCVFTPDDTNTCTDSNACTIGDHCTSGACVPGVSPAAVQFCNTGTITMPTTVAPATPYPSSISVVNQPSVICSVTAKLNAVSHSFPDDIDVLMAGPTPTNNLIIMSDVGGGTSTIATPATLTLVDGSPLLPDAGPLVTGTFRPTNIGAGDPFAGAPAPTANTTFAATFNGTNPNGTWSLYVVDDSSGDSGTISGWCVSIAAICVADADCNDKNVCTDDTCVGGACVHTNNLTLTVCDDNNACTTGDTCSNGVCVGGPPPTCDDGDVCTNGSCNPATGLCEYTPVICNDNNACTDDMCVSANDEGCRYTPDDTNTCTDNDACTQTDVCIGGTCTGTNPVFCNDSNVCTTDTCNPATGLCVYTNNTGPCDDGNACTGPDQCGPRLAENFDGVTAPAIPAGWTSTVIIGGAADAWKTVTSPNDTAPNAANTIDAAVVTDKVLISPTINIVSGSAKLTFKNNYSLESGFDGGVLEMSINGAGFTDITSLANGGSFVTGGYNGTISTAFSSPIAGRAAWTATSAGFPAAFLTTTVNLGPNAAGFPIVLRWRVATDTSVAGTGQNIDSIVITDPTNVCNPGPAIGCDDGDPCTIDSCDPGPLVFTPPCTLPDNGGGTVDLPPAGCPYLSPQDVHEIIDGLPPGTTIRLAVQHQDFFCQPNNPVCSFPVPPGSRCSHPDGMGGEQECSGSTLSMQLQGTGMLSGYNRTVNLPIAFETHIGPRTPGAPVQSFDTDMFRLFGQINNIGDPDFDLLRIVGGTDFSMPSPGHTTLRQQGGNTWSVDSFFDIEYRIDFIGAPGSQLAGRSGSTTGTIRMSTGAGIGCVHSPVVCNDNNPCTDDSCDPATGMCVYTNDDTNTCSDGDPCTTDACVSGVCVGTDIVCDDTNECTDDACDPLTGMCVYTPDDTNTCSDGDLCTTDACVSGVCVGTDIVCNDNNPCTDDTCDPTTGMCVYTNDDTNTCSDGDPCTQTDVCQGGMCVGTNPVLCDDLNPCTDDACNPATGMCESLPDDTNTCTDGMLCTTDACVNGTCVSTPIICNDNNDCTDDVCNPATGMCVYTPDDTNTCTDNNPCTIDVCRAGMCVCPTGGACTPSAPATFTQTTPLVIPDNTAAPVTSTLAVALPDPYLYDLDLKTFITHTFPGDLDITLKSPLGTVTTISTANGGGSDNVFNGTTWNDQADPLNQAPFGAATFAASKIVTDHLYVNNQIETTLVPEEALGAFIGENPNGIWTLTVRDHAGLDTGTVTSWSLSFKTLSMAPTQTTTSWSNTTAVPISTGAPATITSTLTVGPVGTQLGKVKLTTNITHTSSGQLEITLKSPSGKIATISSRNGGTNDDVFKGTMWFDTADPDSQIPYPPVNPNIVTDHTYANLTTSTPSTIEDALALFQGDDPNGIWTVTISDVTNLDGGSLNSWTLDITTDSCVPSCATVCDDHNPCTTDTCDPMVPGGCVYTPNSDPCNDGNVCTSGDVCSGGMCAGTPNSDPCNDGNACTTGDICSGGTCSGTLVTCNDGNVCTTDTCNPANGLCVYTNNTNACDDGNACTVGDVCAPLPGPCGISENFDGVTAPAIPAGWTSTVIVGAAVDAWKTVSGASDTAPNHANTIDPATVTDKVLVSPPIFVSFTSPQVTFRNNYTLESTFDGGVLEIKIGAGAFTDIITAGGSFVTGGYNGTISTAFSSPIAGRQAWTGASAGFPAYITTTANLPVSAVGQTIQLRWRVATDTSVASTGQNIDTIVIGGFCANVCTPGAATVCDDTNPCTDDACNPANGNCVYTPDDTNTCDDGNACTTDVCNMGNCTSNPVVIPEISDTESATKMGMDAIITWNSPPGPFNVYRGSRSTPTWMDNHMCFAPNVPAPPVIDSGVPPDGTSYYYLVSRRDPCGESGLGHRSNGVPRPNVTPCP